MKNASHRANDTRRGTEPETSLVADSSLAPLEAVPSDLRALRRWVTWRDETRNGKTTKRPAQRVDDAEAWLSLDDAVARVASGEGRGVGFVLGAGVVGIDLDHCIDADGRLHEIASDALTLLGTYCERSPSGRGLHVLIRGRIAEPKNVRKQDGVPGRELYDGRNGSARYFTVTGDRVGTALEVREGPQAQAALDAFIGKWFSQEPRLGNEPNDAGHALDDDWRLQVMLAAKDGPKWRRLFEGNHSAYPSPSEADLALCGKLRFYTHGNAQQMDRLFRRSGLMRAKWDEKHGEQTYGELTVAKAIAKGGPYYMPRDPAERANSRDTWERTAWARIPAWVFMRLGGAGELACRVYGIIACYADADTGEAWPAIETIAFHCRVTPRRVMVALSKLKACGVLTWTQRMRDSNLYRLTREVPESVTPYALRRVAPRMMESITRHAAPPIASRVTESITPHALGRVAPRVTESGHLGCRPRGTVTNHEPTIVNTGGGRDTP